MNITADLKHFSTFICTTAGIEMGWVGDEYNYA